MHTESRFANPDEDDGTSHKHTERNKLYVKHFQECFFLYEALEFSYLYCPERVASFNLDNPIDFNLQQVGALCCLCVVDNRLPYVVCLLLASCCVHAFSLCACVMCVALIITLLALPRQLIEPMWHHLNEEWHEHCANSSIHPLCGCFLMVDGHAKVFRSHCVEPCDPAEPGLANNFVRHAEC